MLDIFEILGPVMIGPSSSHTAGAAKIGAMARTLLGAPPVRAAIHLYGSFAETGAGHGTDRALVGGLLGMKPDDPRLPDAFAEAEKAGLTYTIDEIKLRDAHPNTAVIEAKSADGRTLTMQASSIGGGRIMVNKLDGIDVNFNGMFNTLVIRNQDASGTVAAITSILSQLRVNVANMSLYRHKRGGDALVALRGGTGEQIGHAVAMALKNLMGLICDPVAGLVEVPCVKRNVIGAVNAVSVADMAMAGITSRIPVDEVIDAMGEVGRRMPVEFRETALGGLAVTPTGQAITERIRKSK